MQCSIEISSASRVQLSCNDPDARCFEAVGSNGWLRLLFAFFGLQEPLDLRQRSRLARVFPALELSAFAYVTFS